MIVADVYKADVLVGYFSQHPGGVTEFDYKDDAAVVPSQPACPLYVRLMSLLVGQFPHFSPTCCQKVDVFLTSSGR